MRSEIVEFCNEIKEEYLLFLYNKGEKLNFPYCCKLSADLITSFFKIVCSDKFQYICTTRIGAYNHAWTYYNDSAEEFIIDFTNLQYTNTNVNRMKNREISNEEFKRIISTERVVFNPEETYMYATYDWMYPKEQECFGVISNFQGTLCKNDFMRYIKDNYEYVFKETVYD